MSTDEAAQARSAGPSGAPATSSDTSATSCDTSATSGRQRVERVRGSRRARLTPAPGTDAEPLTPEETDDAPSPGDGAPGPNDARLRQDVPPHY
jgi:hypothetical protein